MASDPPQSIDLPLAWIGYDDVPILFANQLLVQHQQDGSFVIGLGQATAPALIGRPEELAEQAAQIEFVPVRTLARVVVTEAKLREFILALEVNLDRFEQTRERLDPRGGES